ncbi:hypothetical protein [Paenibacillus sp. GCM10012303]|uniref:hypothetical protein n=1 Tax=Paenibacillus sp. GCM10012303 TaxID=3317340 RepID=UPI00360A2A02
MIKGVFRILVGITKLLLPFLIFAAIWSGIMQLLTLPYPKINHEQFSKIQIGMTVDEMIDIAGKKGFLEFESSNQLFTQQDYAYIRKFDFSARSFFYPLTYSLDFINGRLAQKSFK